MGSSNELWDAKRKRLERAIIDAVMDGFDHVSVAETMLLKVPGGESVGLIVAAGPVDEVRKMLNDLVKGEGATDGE